MTTSRLPIALICSIFLTSQALATDVGGPIVTDTTWTLAGSPYNVVVSIIVGGNATLTIQPGVVVRFNPGLGITVGSQAWGIGGLKAIGTASQKIRFTSNTNPGQPGHWKDILFSDRSIDASFDEDEEYLSGSILKHCVIEFGGGGAQGSGAVTITQSSPWVNSCEVRNSARTGIYANNTATPPIPPLLQIMNSSIHHNNSTGIQSGGGAYLSVNGLLFTGNTIFNNIGTADANGGGGGGLYVSLNGTGSEFNISSNTFTNNTVGFSGVGGYMNGGGGMNVQANATNSTISISNNIISGNSGTGSGSFTGGGGVAMLIQSQNSEILFTGNTISNNSINFNGSNNGGGAYIVFLSNPSFIMQNNTIVGNQAVSGGGVYLSSITNSQAPIVTLMGNTIASNSARGSGGGDGRGGALYVESSAICCTWYGSLVVNLVANHITGNTASGSPTGGSGLGGAIYATELLTSQATTLNLAGSQANSVFNILSGNTADFGDAIYNNMLHDENGPNDIQAGYVCWGGLNRNPLTSPNLIYDFFDNPQKSFVIYGQHVTGSNCTTTSGCGTGLIRDCNGNCAPVAWIGDAYCDAGFYTYNGVPIFFNCPQFGNDGNQCNTPQPPIQNPPNHNVPEPLPQYSPPAPPPPTPTKLVYITHGWIPLLYTSAQEVEARMNSLEAYRAMIDDELGPDWQVRTYVWAPDAHTVTPVTALTNAISHGQALGATLATQVWEHVHFIGHSAGSGLIAAAAVQLNTTNTTVHTTFLDAYGGVATLGGVGLITDAYGLHSDWSDHYFSRERHGPCAGILVNTGFFSQLHLPNCHNVDVSWLDSEYTALCLSDHAWPYCFYGYTVDAVSTPDTDNCPPGGMNGSPAGYGFPLSFEEFTGPGGFAEWKAARLANHPNNPNNVVELGGAGGGGGGATWVVAVDPPMDLALTPRFPSNPDAVQATATTLTMTTHPPGATQPAPAWINFQITTTTPINFVAFELTHTGDANAAGLLTMYVDGTKCGVIDEVYALAGLQQYRMPTPDTLAPGDHFLSFRLDHFNQLVSSVTIQNVASGLGGFVTPTAGDMSCDGVVNQLDIARFASALADPSAYDAQYPTCPHTRADMNADGLQDGRDVSYFVEFLLP